MVKSEKQKQLFSEEVDVPKVDLNWSSIALSEVQQKGNRLEASLYDIVGRKAHEVVKNCKFPIKPLCSKNGLAEAYHRPRFKRIYVDKSEYPIFQPSQINDIYPKPHIWISENTPTDIEALRVKKGQILMTCSGTIGNCTIVGDTLDNAIFSHDLLRITPENESYTGYIYAYLITKTGNAIVSTNNYGAVISHIEPDHLSNVLVPDPSPLIRENINTLVLDSVKMLDDSNQMLDEAENLLINELQLPKLDSIRTDQIKQETELKNYQIKLSELNNRLDPSYHSPIIKGITKHLRSHAKEITTLSDNRISSEIILPGRFKRVYVEEGQGMPFIGGKQIYELDPSNKKYLSLSHHSSRIKEQLYLHENMIVVTCSGTIGKINIIPKHWEKWTMNQHVMRIVPANDDIAGYIYAWLNTDYGLEFIKRFTYGAVVDEIHDRHMKQVEIPLLKSKKVQTEINNLVLKSNELRYLAYKKEQKAKKMVNELVLQVE